MSEQFLVCPRCEHYEAAEERRACPNCESTRAYLNHAPALPDAESEAYVKLDADAAAETR
ncbi:MAG: hypothetical protein ACI8UR_002398 [Natronomonas sp.]|jgi:hypothetical protein|uniref:hypothetical protein n=1 Tax=Natronomonas sp. TaxID=2184060 RepID=UPI0039E6F419